MKAASFDPVIEADDITIWSDKMGVAMVSPTPITNAISNRRPNRFLVPVEQQQHHTSGETNTNTITVPTTTKTNAAAESTTGKETNGTAFGATDNESRRRRGRDQIGSFQLASPCQKVVKGGQQEYQSFFLAGNDGRNATSAESNENSRSQQPRPLNTQDGNNGPSVVKATDLINGCVRGTAEKTVYYGRKAQQYTPSREAIRGCVSETAHKTNRRRKQAEEMAANIIDLYRDECGGDLQSEGDHRGNDDEFFVVPPKQFLRTTVTPTTTSIADMSTASAPMAGGNNNDQVEGRSGATGLLSKTETKESDDDTADAFRQRSLRYPEANHVKNPQEESMEMPEEADSPLDLPAPVENTTPVGLRDYRLGALFESDVDKQVSKARLSRVLNEVQLQDKTIEDLRKELDESQKALHRLQEDLEQKTIKEKMREKENTSLRSSFVAEKQKMAEQLQKESDENAKLNTKISTLQLETSELRSSLRTAKSNLQKQTQIWKELHDEAASIHSDTSPIDATLISSLRAELVDLKDRLQDAKDAETDANKKAEKATMAAQDANKRAEEAQSAAKEAEKALAESKTRETTAVSTQSAPPSQKLTSKVTNRAEVIRLKNRLVETERELQRFRLGNKSGDKGVTEESSSVSEVSAKNDGGKEKKTIVGTEKKTAVGTELKYKAKLQALAKTTDTLRKANQQLQQSLDDVQQKHAAELQKHKLQAQQVKSSLQLQKRDTQKLRKDFDDLQEKHEKLYESKRTLQIQNAQLHKASQHVNKPTEELQITIKSLERENAQLSASNEELNAVLIKTCGELQATRNSEAALSMEVQRSRRRELDSGYMPQEISRLRDRVRQLQHDNAVQGSRLEEHIQALKYDNEDQRRNAVKEIMSCQSQIDQQRAEIGNLKTKLSESDQRAVDETSSRLREKRSLEAQIEAKDKANVTLQASIRSLREKLAETERVLAEAESSRSGNTAQSTSKASGSNGGNTENEVLLAQVSKLAGQLNDAQASEAREKVRADTEEKLRKELERAMKREMLGLNARIKEKEAADEVLSTISSGSVSTKMSSDLLVADRNVEGEVRQLVVRLERAKQKARTESQRALAEQQKAAAAKAEYSNQIGKLQAELHSSIDQSNQARKMGDEKPLVNTGTGTSSLEKMAAQTSSIDTVTSPSAVQKGPFISSLRIQPVSLPSPKYRGSEVGRKGPPFAPPRFQNPSTSRNSLVTSPVTTSLLDISEESTDGEETEGSPVSVVQKKAPGVPGKNDKIDIVRIQRRLLESNERLIKTKSKLKNLVDRSDQMAEKQTNAKVRADEIQARLDTAHKESIDGYSVPRVGRVDDDTVRDISPRSSAIDAIANANDVLNKYLTKAGKDTDSPWSVQPSTSSHDDDIKRLRPSPIDIYREEDKI